MGTRRTYQCKKCNYSAHVSGGQDMGLVEKTNTVICYNCNELVDIVTEYYTKVILTDNINKCPKCGSTEYLKEWDNKKRLCPKCNGAMIISPNTEITIWD
ncbi:MAG: hypothetical protein Kow0068_07740 [Marinilabiliales bacterium]